MEQSQRFKINSPTVIHEVIDDEAVIVNMHSGHYYSLSRVGADIWKLLDEGYAVGQIQDAVEKAYIVEKSEVAAGVQELVAQLQAEALIIPDSDGADRGAGDATAVSDRSADHTFERPVLEKYSDMEDLLLLDPIHEVTEGGQAATEPDLADKAEPTDP